MRRQPEGISGHVQLFKTPCLESGAAGGNLAWHDHTVVFDLDAPVTKVDYIVDDIQAGVYDIGLTWNTKPDTKTGEMLAATFFWRIPKGELAGPCYIISAERPTPEGVVFTLRQDGSENVVRKSPVCRLEKAFHCKVEDIAKHVTLVRPEDLEPNDKNSPNKAREATAKAFMPAAGQPSRQP
jgi:hypothetical protein